MGAITRDLRPLVPAGATVQVMDTTEGGIHALLRLRLRQPTRFIYDFHFFHDVGDPRIGAAGRVRGRSRRAAVPPPWWCFGEAGRSCGYERLAGFPELVRAARALASLWPSTATGYRIYAKRSDS